MLLTGLLRLFTQITATAFIPWNWPFDTTALAKSTANILAKAAIFGCLPQLKGRGTHLVPNYY